MFHPPRPWIGAGVALALLVPLAEIRGGGRPVAFVKNGPMTLDEMRTQVREHFGLP